MYQINNGNTSRKKIAAALNFTASALVLLFAFSVFMIITKVRAYKKSSKSYESLLQYVTSETVTVEQVTGTGDLQENGVEPNRSIVSQGEEENIQEYIRLQQIGADFGALSTINSDVVAWISIPSTKVNYPVTQCGNNDYYLNHIFTGEWNVCGCIFLDSKNANDFSGRNNIIYGHCMNDGSMFASVTNYSKQSYYEAHPYGLLYTPEGTYKVEFFSGYVSEPKGDPWKKNFESEEEYIKWHDVLVDKSQFVSEVPFTGADRVLTLSTCTNAYDDARFVLHGVIRNSN